MRELNIEFQEQYKRFDKLCRDMYSSGEGVSAYIMEMEQAPYNMKNSISDWDITLKQLKHLRWKRNQLAHEIDINTSFCEQDDIDWVMRFCDSILNGTDPLALACKKQQSVPQKSPQVHIGEPPKRKSLWERITCKIKSWFS